MATMIYRELFNEMPYAAALNNDELPVRCSTCFADEAAIPCTDEDEWCRKVVYCSEECRDWDQPNHTYECVAFRKIEGQDIDQFVRLLARILTRRLVDDGVANLSENFPENIRDRCLADLISHQSEIEANEHRLDEMEKSLKEFLEVYSDTPQVDDSELAKRMYCIMWINCFSVSGPLSMKVGHESPLGLGFYLNVSRFDHSCRPDLHVHFDGARLVVQYPSTISDDEAAAAEEWLSMTRSAKKFNQLTISYGFSGAFTNDSYFPLRRQRRESLLFGYYFECHCDLCDDDRAAALEEHAALIECPKCGEPYVWKEVDRRLSFFMCWSSPSDKSTMTCQKSCSCSSDEEELNLAKAYVRKLDPDSRLPALEQEWAHAMSFRMEEQYANEVIERCEPVWEKLWPFWHRTANLRMTQLQERLFSAYSVTAMDSWSTDNTIDARILKMALLMGESSIAWYQRNEGDKPYDAATSAYAYELAQLYELSATIAKTTAVYDRSRASYWYRFAASVWQPLGEYSSAFVQQLTAEAERAESAAAALLDPPEMEVSAE